MLQLQPQWRSGELWMELAREEDYTFEVLELNAPPVIGDPIGYEACLQWYRTNGRVSSLHGAFIDNNPASGDPLFRKLSRQRCRESCQLARSLGADRVVFHGSAFPFLRGGYLDNWTAQCAQFYAELAQEYGLRVYLENAQDLDPYPLRAVMETISGANVFVCLDVGHAYYSRTPVAQWFQELGDYIGYLHLSDNNGQFDDHLPLGDGHINWKEVDRLWRQLPADLPITLEVGGIGGVRRSLAYLRENGLFGQGGSCHE